MPRSYLIGIHSFIGRALADCLASEGHEIAGLARHEHAEFSARHPEIRVEKGDVLDRAFLLQQLRAFRPDYVFHLAAQSLPVVSWEKPEETLRVNVEGTLNVLEAVRASGLDPVVEIFLSSSEYATGTAGVPIREDHRLEPASPYAVSKIAAGQLAELYGRRYDLRIIRVRPFFLIGPGKLGDVSAHFCRQIALVEKGKMAAMKVGNLKTVRDYLDVRDGARGLWQAAFRGAPGGVYNIASGQPCPISELLDLYLSHAKCKVPVESDDSLLRPFDEPYKVGDVTRLKSLGWAPQYRLKDTTREILEDWRVRVEREAGL